MMHDFVTTYANRNASTADFQRIVEKHMGSAHGLVLQRVRLWDGDSHL